MHRYSLFFILFLIAGSLFAQDLRQMRLTGTPAKADNEMVTRRDRNGNYCAAIQVISDMDGFSYDAFDGVVGNVDSRPGMDIVYLTATERVLEIYQRGYQPLKLILSEHGIRLQPREVWQITIAGDALPPQTLPVTIRVVPADATLTINGSRTENSPTHRLTPGNHAIKITKEGYKTIQQTIAVSEQKVFFEYTLERQPDAGLQISTTPAGAIVYLDGVNLGETPLAVFYKPGTYPVRIVKEGYVTLENQTLEIALPQTTKSYTLDENAGYLTVNTHSGATVYFNGEAVSNPNNVKLPPQLVRVKVTMPKAEPLEQQVVLKRNDRLTLDMYPDVQTGTLQVAVTPFDAKIELTGDAGEKYTATGMKVFEDIPVGEYELKLSAKGFQSFVKQIEITINDRISEQIILVEGSDYDLGIEMVFVKGGSYTMGCINCSIEEKSTHKVNVKDFYIGKYEVTQRQWFEIMGENPSYLNICDECPVENISSEDVRKFIRKLNRKTGKKYRLPTEAEWEYAARGGNQSRVYEYAGSNNIDEVAWYAENSGRKPNPVGQKKPNELGIYDMSGNVWELCEDHWIFKPKTAPRRGQARYVNDFLDRWLMGRSYFEQVIRGGSWLSGSDSGRCCHVNSRKKFNSELSVIYDERFANPRLNPYYVIGFRLAHDL